MDPTDFHMRGAISIYLSATLLAVINVLYQVSDETGLLSEHTRIKNPNEG
jgi:hypothetical protein